jgi:death-on-curing protein
MTFLTADDVIRIQADLIRQTGGAPGILDRGKIESAVAQPRVTFGGVELYPTLVEKASALGYSLAMNHGFADGNKRIAHAALETLLVLNGFELRGDVGEQEGVYLRLAAGTLSREEFSHWVADHVVPLAAGE